MPDRLQFTRVDFRRFKAFESFTLHLRHFNILVGPNNAGKSTILSAFRILAAGMRRANQRKAQVLDGPDRRMWGYVVDLTAISVAEENIFYNYDAAEGATVTFTLSNKGKLTLYFPEREVCFLFAEDDRGQIQTPVAFRSRFNCPISFVPVLGPVDHNERLFEKEAARLALFNYRAARNFRNIWHHYPEKFDEFRAILGRTWPGMDIERPSVDASHDKPVLHMFCPEERIPREIFWAGFGFQVWCQMLTHLIQSSEASIFLVDEPDIYIHSELQRQLLGLLRDLGPDILIATHSTEIITEAETDDIVLIDKKRRHARRISDPTELGNVFSDLGSNLNPVLTQLARTKRAVFVEGKDFQIFSKFARKLNLGVVANRSQFAVIPVGGFSPERIRSLKRGMEATLGAPIASAAILDRDYRSDEECQATEESCREFCNLVIIHRRKEVENFLLIPSALDRAIERRMTDRARRSGEALEYSGDAASLLKDFAASKKAYVTSQYLDRLRQYRPREKGKGGQAATQALLEDFERIWSDAERQAEVIPGKEALAHLNQQFQEHFKVSITPTGIVDAMRSNEIPKEMIELLAKLKNFADYREHLKDKE